jgi:hypothetical protein
MSEIVSQVSIPSIKSIEKLSRLIADAYKGSEDKLERDVCLSRSIAGSDRTYEEIHYYICDYLEQQEYLNKGRTIRSILGRLPSPRLDLIAKGLGIDVDNISSENRLTEIFKKLAIDEYKPPIGFHSVFAELNHLRTEIDDSHDYGECLSSGIITCKRFERLLKWLIIFYGGFCYERVFLTCFELHNQAANR